MSELPISTAEPVGEQRYREGQKVTWVSIAVNIGLTIAQIGIGLATHAQSLVADGFHSLSDLVADFLVLVANFHSRHPADEEHPYGHQRIETAASLALGLILVGTGAAILWYAAGRLQHLDALPAVAPLAFWTALATIAAKEGLFRYMLHVGTKLRSPMLIANAWHARSDAASSLVAAAGIGGSLLGLRWLDPVAAVIVGFMILRMGWVFAWDSLRELMDEGLAEHELADIRAALSKTPGVLGVHDLRTRRMAQQVLVDAHIRVDGRISVSEGHHIAESARQRVLAAQPQVLDVLVHVDTEDDTQPAGRAPATLPEREVLLGHLRALLGLEGSGIEKAVFHYRGEKVEAEVFLAPELAADPTRMDGVRARLAAGLSGDSAFRNVSLHSRIAPK
ncbi:MAG: cation diffusion facilitator family transporter [Rhodocyclaceae bacterium]|nr:cation diffusion facilitator family transporter [Rhodocyclaceae bacterium]